MHKAASYTSLVIVLALVPLLAFAQAMEGTLYRIEFDSINTGGGLSTSSLYSLEDTVGEQATGTSSSGLYTMRAGYQQMNETYISITSPANATLPSISGIGGGTTTTSVTWTVITDDPAGYSLAVRANDAPALAAVSGASFLDYIPSGADPDFTFSLPVGESRFGFSPEGDDIHQRYLDNGSACNTGSSESTAKCFDGFSTSDATIASRATPNGPVGSDVSILFQAGIGSSKIQDAGTYTATIIVTATPQ